MSNVIRNPSKIISQMPDIFQTCRDIPLVEIIQRYAPAEIITKAGRSWLLCPLHAEKTPSFTFKGERFYCFGCNTSGDGVDFVSKIYNLKSIDAARLIASDFGFEVDLAQPLTPTQRQEIRQHKKMKKVNEVFRLAVDQAYMTLCDVRIECCRIIDATGVYGFRLSHVPDMIDLYLDALQFGTDTEKLEILKNGEVEKWKRLLP